MIQLNKTTKTAGIILFWVLIVTMNLSQTLLSSSVRGWEFIWSEQIIYVIGWFLWIFYTPFITYLLRRIPISNGISIRFILKLMGIGLVFTLLHTILNILLEYSLWNIFIERTNKISDFYGVFFYRYHVNLFIFLFLMGVGYTNDYLNRSRKLEIEKTNLKKLLTDTELTVLKMQLNPHFLFNTHHNIIGLILEEDNNKAIKMLTRLSDLLRITLYNTDQQFTTVEKEIDTLNMYLEIHKIRFEDRLKVKLMVDSNIKDCKMPHLLLLPLIENALQHGISKSSDSGLIEISLKNKNEYIEIYVRDDGPGIINSQKNGIGLTNTSQRLNQLFDKNHSFSFQNISPKGFEVEIKIPKEYAIT